MKSGLDPGASCDERERNVAIAAALLALLLAFGIMMAAVLMETESAPVAPIAELATSGANAGTGSGGGFGARCRGTSGRSPAMRPGDGRIVAQFGTRCRSPVAPPPATGRDERRGSGGDEVPNWKW